MSEAEPWKRCNGCKKPIAYRSTYYVCSVSTCNRKRTGLFFCSVECWETHLPIVRHREAWAVEETAPTREQWLAELAREGGEPVRSEPAKPQPSAPIRRTGGAPESSPPLRRPAESSAPAPRPAVAAPPRRPEPAAEEVPRRIRIDSAPAEPPTADEVLVVVSRFKGYIRQRFGCNTSDGVFDVLSDHLRRIAAQAVDNARMEGRKTVLERDFEFLERR